jgi:hypothetical protein
MILHRNLLFFSPFSAWSVFFFFFDFSIEKNAKELAGEKLFVDRKRPK